MSTPPDPYSYDLARALAAENAELRELLEAVDQELERLAARRECDPAAFLARAARIRARLHSAAPYSRAAFLALRGRAPVLRHRERWVRAGVEPLDA